MVYQVVATDHFSSFLILPGLLGSRCACCWWYYWWYLQSIRVAQVVQHIYRYVFSRVGLPCLPEQSQERRRARRRATSRTSICSFVRGGTGSDLPGFLLVEANGRPRVARVWRQFLDEDGIDAPLLSLLYCTAACSIRIV